MKWDGGHILKSIEDLAKFGGVNDCTNTYL